MSKERAYRISKIEFHSPMPSDSLTGEDLGATAEGLQQVVDRWSATALASPDGMAVGGERFGIIDISTTHKELFITVPA